MSSKSYAAIIHEHLQARFDWWYSLYNSLLETAAAYENNQPFSTTPYEDATLLENLNQDVDWSYQMSKALAEELGRAESALNAPKPTAKPKPAPEPAPPSPFLAPGDDPAPEPDPTPEPTPEPEPSAFAGRQVAVLDAITIPAVHRDDLEWRNLAWRFLERRHYPALLLAGRQPAFDAPTIRISVMGEVS